MPRDFGQNNSKRQDFDQQEISRTVVVPKRAVFKTLIFVLAALFFFCPKNGLLKKPFFGSKCQTPFQRAKPFAKNW